MRMNAVVWARKFGFFVLVGSASLGLGGCGANVPDGVDFASGGGEVAGTPAVGTGGDVASGAGGTTVETGGPGAASAASPNASAALPPANFAELDIYTPLAKMLVPASAAVEAQIAAAGEQNTTVRETPMGRRFVAASGHETTAADRKRLASGTLLPELPAEMRWRRFTVRLFDAAGPKVADINQNGFGTCGGVAAMGGLAFQNPNFVRRLIVERADGTYLVHMFDPQGKPVDVVVNNLFVAGESGALVNVSDPNDEVNWASVLEKATMVYNMVFHIWGEGSTAAEAVEGIGSEEFVPLFTGNGRSLGYPPKKLSAEAMRVVVARAMLSGDVVVGGFTKDTVVQGYDVYSYHAYTISSVGTDTDRLLQMRNPWGHAYRGGESDASAMGVVSIARGARVQPTIDLRVISAGAAFGGSRVSPMLP